MMLLSPKRIAHWLRNNSRAMIITLCGYGVAGYSMSNYIIRNEWTLSDILVNTVLLMVGLIFILAAAAKPFK